LHFAAFAHVGESVREPPLDSLNDIGEARSGDPSHSACFCGGTRRHAGANLRQ
jgi:hypothetical protein